MNFFILHTKIVDWMSLSESNFLNQDISHLLPEFKKRWPHYLHFIKSWNRSSKINFFEFKHKLKKIAIHNREKCGMIDTHLTWHETEKMISQMGEKDCFAILDDDDIFNPQVKELEVKGYDCALWTHGRLQIDEILQNPKGFKAFGTCNFGITKQGWKNTSDKNVLMNHVLLNESFLPRNNLFLDEQLSLTLKTAASICNINGAWENGISPEAYIKEFFITPKKIPHEYEWASDEIQKVFSLCREAFPSIKMA